MMGYSQKGIFNSEDVYERQLKLFENCIVNRTYWVNLAVRAVETKDKNSYFSTIVWLCSHEN